MSDQATIFIVDDDPSIRDALSLLISLRGMRTRIFECAEHFLSGVTNGAVGCVLTDLKMPGLSGIELQLVLRQRKISLPIVVLTAHGNVANTRLAFKNGAFDFLEKPVDDELLIDVLRNAVQSQRIEAAIDNSVSDRLRLLSAREREVFGLLAQGHLLIEIGDSLGISPRTVEVHKARVMAKLQCRTLADIIRVSLTAGILG
jgi:two-component system response regulator FixJ